MRSDFLDVSGRFDLSDTVSNYCRRREKSAASFFVYVRFVAAVCGMLSVRVKDLTAAKRTFRAAHLKTSRWHRNGRRLAFVLVAECLIWRLPLRLGMKLLWLALCAALAVASNLPSAVVLLNEKFLHVKHEGFWFVKLYAPWCGHCKRLAPVWEHVGHALADLNSPVRVAKIDCTRFPAMCNQLGVHAYPTITFFRNGKAFDYDGERKKEAMVDFALKAAAPTVQEIQNMNELNEIRGKSRTDPSFVFVDFDKIENDEEVQRLRKGFEKSAESMFGKTRFYKMRREILPNDLIGNAQTSSVFVLKDAPPTAFAGTSADLISWILGERWPLIIECSGHNIAEVASTQKLLVLATVDAFAKKSAGSPHNAFFDKFTEAAKAARKDEQLSEVFQFGWLDGNEIANSITLSTFDVPGLLVFNYTAYEYFLGADKAAEMTKESILVWLKSVRDGEIEALGGRGILSRVKRMVYEVYSNVHQMFSTQPLLTTCLFGVPIAFLSIIIYSICSADFTVDRDEVYPDSEYSDDEDRPMPALADDGPEFEEEEEEVSPHDPSHYKSE